VQGDRDKESLNLLGGLVSSPRRAIFERIASKVASRLNEDCRGMTMLARTGV
jgi:hypothetical protein